jgi:hypothetical protein
LILPRLGTVAQDLPGDFAEISAVARLRDHCRWDSFA